MNNLERIVIIGRALYGARWQRPTAKLLGVDPKLVRKWVVGSLNPIDRHVSKMGTAAKSHLEDVAEAIQRTQEPDD